MSAVAADRRSRSTTRPRVVEHRSTGRDTVVDAFALVVLTTIALVGLRSVLVGSEWVVAGAAGVVVGTAAGWAISVRRLSPLAGFLVLLAAFVLGSGAADPDHAIAVVLPGPGGPSALIDGLVHSWKALVTTQPPVTARDGIGVIPYLMGFVG